MAIKSVVDKLEEVPEQYRDLFKERNGKFEVTEIEGMKTDADVTRLSSALEKERKDHKAVRQTLITITGDRKPEDIITLLDRIPELELAAEGKVDENKLNDMVEKRIGAKIGPVQRKLDTLTQQNIEKDQIIAAYIQKDRTRSIHDAVREAIGKAQGFQGAAVEDALMFAERMLEVTDEGKVITKDNVGVTPGVDAVVWLTDMQQRKPHWWGPSSGGGAGGNGGKNNGNGSTNPWSHENWNMTEQGRLYNENPARAEQMAKAAGTHIGGMRPVARK